ncbi:hypothetical protein AGMMS49949_03100 [Alphaproteobacteria bacterium]|nr:hypothetical protein AGMMS49949_03100 [Alphaproteobacteria bacterium]GHS97947.1 hypothetical protein AGMMS50296_5290 [Alphaproteobacteria bacterium]
MISNPEQDLWKAVIAQAIRDIFTRSSALHRKSALAWFYYNSRDYKQVCQLASVDSRQLRKAILEALFLRPLIKKGKKHRGKLKKHVAQTKDYEFVVVEKAKALFQALYSQQDLDKAIGKLSFQDCLDLCSRIEKKTIEKEVSHDAV